jgi:hypothetical protein
MRHNIAPAREAGSGLAGTAASGTACQGNAHVKTERRRFTLTVGAGFGLSIREFGLPSIGRPDTNVGRCAVCNQEFERPSAGRSLRLVRKGGGARALVNFSVRNQRNGTTALLDPTPKTSRVIMVIDIFDEHCGQISLNDVDIKQAFDPWLVFQYCRKSVTKSVTLQNGVA